jgi:hypothetical protein
MSRGSVRGDDHGLVFAARLQHVNDHQFGLREEPLLGFRAGCFRRAHDPAEMLILGYAAEMVEADARQVADFIFGEYFLAEFDPNHV